MLKFNLKLTLRNLYKNKLYTFVNVAGLSVAIAVCLYTALWVYHESTYDRFHADGEQIYRCDRVNRLGSVVEIQSTVPTSHSGLPEKLRREFAGITQTLRVDMPPQSKIESTENALEGVRGIEADANFFRFFTYSIIRGERQQLLRKDHVVISESLAEKLFGSTEGAVGQTLTLDEQRDLVVSGVMQNPPQKSNLQFSWVSLLAKDKEIGWNEFALSRNYVKIPHKENAKQIKASIQVFLKKEKKATQFTSENEEKNFLRYQDFILNPLFQLNFRLFFKVQMLLFCTISFLILWLAVSNFVNMSIARSSLRAREIGLRKVAGSSRKELLLLFFIESFIVVALAMGVALVLLELSLPFINRLTTKGISLYQEGLGFYLFFSLLALLLLCSAGALLPFRYLSRLSPTEVLSGNPFFLKKPKLQRRLLAFQFGTGLFLLIASVVITQQIERSMEKFPVVNDLVYHLQFSGKKQLASIASFKSELEKRSAIQSVIMANSRISGIGMAGIFKAANSAQEKIQSQCWEVEPHFSSLYGLKIHEPKKLRQDGTTYGYVNEAFMRKMGWKSTNGKSLTNKGEVISIAGFLEDFSYDRSNREIYPLVVMVPKRMKQAEVLALKLREGSQLPARQEIEQLWKQYFQEAPMHLSSFGQEVSQLFEQDYRFRNLIVLFALISGVLTLMGLFALSVYTVERRTKEMGVRKVFGADARDILRLLFWDFSKIILKSAAWAFPLSYAILYGYLQAFAYRISLGPQVFLPVLFLVWLVASLTVSYHSWQVARANPVDALRNE